MTPLRIPLAAWCVAVLVVILPLLLGPRRCRAIGLLGQILPPVVLASCAIIYLVLPAMGVSLGLWPRRLHQFGALLLGTFLVAGVVLQATAYARIAKGGTMAGIHACFVRWWCITEVAPAVAALLLLCSGLRLIFEAPVSSVTVPYIFYMLMSFSLFFFDGLLFYRPQIAKLKDAARTALEANSNAVSFRASIADVGRDLQLLIHFASFPFVFWFGYSKPILIHPYRRTLLRCEVGLQSFLSPAWARVAVAAFLIVIVGALLLLLRRRKEK
jgi:hypothetical protein